MAGLLGCGILFLSLVFAGRINRAGVYTVSQFLELRYGRGGGLLSGVVMWAYTLMLAVTSTIAYGTVFGVLFDIGKVPSIIIGGAVVVTYSVLGNSIVNCSFLCVNPLTLWNTQVALMDTSYRQEGWVQCQRKD